MNNPLIGVLDHGFVRLVDSMGSDLSIVRSARVSYNADWRKEGDENARDGISKDERLISYLLRNWHTSPFESVVFTFEIKCPIFVARQWHRHRTWAYNEVSARYTEMEEEFYVPAEDKIGTQSEHNKQVRILEHEKAGPMRKLNASEYIKDTSEICFEAYKRLLEEKVPREIARLVLPLGTYTRFFGTVNLHNLMHFLKLRLHPHAQYEIRVYAEALFNLIEPIVPVTCKHFMEEIHGV